MSKAKAKGTAWERRLADYLRLLHPNAERRVSEGRNDRGDVSGIPGWVVEAKCCRQIDLAGWIDEAEKEARSAGVSRFAVVFPRRSHATAKAYAVVPLWLLSELMLPDDVPAERSA
ncbi:MAG: hypothetical protein LC798_16970 [Chloroflexi bacterium]|nr:hypothetical protein [Chloroflexota bacterium]